MIGFGFSPSNSPSFNIIIELLCYSNSAGGQINYLSVENNQRSFELIPHPLRMRKSDCTDVELKPRANHQCPQFTYHCI